MLQVCEIEGVWLEFQQNSTKTGPPHIFTEREVAMSQKFRNQNFDQAMEVLRAQAFDVAPSTEVAGGVQVSKYGAGAVLVAAQAGDAWAVFAVRPGVWIGGQVARLVDRGYQKFMKTSQFEIPATANQLHDLHRFTVELKQLIGDSNLYNESLGTTSDRHVYDRLRGRETAPPASPRS
jgi:hypothetical protein